MKVNSTRYVHNLQLALSTCTLYIASMLNTYVVSQLPFGTLKYQGETFVDAVDKANIFADSFSSVFTSEDVTHIPTLTTDSA